MKLIQINLKDKKMLKEFVQMPYKIYQNNPNWVPPIEKSLIKTITYGNSMQLKGGPYTLFMVEDDNSYIARLLVGANNWLREHGIDMVTGPISPTNGDDFRGVLISGIRQKESKLVYFAFQQKTYRE